MKLVERLNSFPLIAVAALLLAGLFGLLIGFVTSDDASPTVQHGDVDLEERTASDDGGPLSGLPVGNRPLSNRQDPGGTRTVRDPATNRNTNPTGTNGNGDTTNPVDTTAAQRKLPDGRTDELVALETPQTPTGAIEVKVEDTNSNPLPFALLALDVDSGPLGWQLVPRQPVVVPETRGVFRFEGLFAGAYRVRSLQANYRAATVEVRLMYADGTEQIALILEPLSYSQVEFFVHYQDGEIPEEVELRILKRGQEDNSGAGRFGKHASTNADGTMGGVIPPTRYRQKTAAGGLVRITLPVGESTDVEFGAKRDNQPYGAQTTVTPAGGVMQQEVVLMSTQDGSLTPSGPTVLGKLALTVTVDGKIADITRINLYQDIDDFKYRPASTTEGNKYVWQNLFTGQWYIVAESSKFHAPFVQQVDVGTETVLDVDIKLGHLRVNAQRAAGTPDPSGGEARYRVRLRPMGSGTIERAYNGNLTGKQSDFIDFFLPAGSYDVRVESPEQYPKLSVSPVEQSLNMTAGGDTTLTFTVSSAATLKFQTVTTAGLPVANPEYLITFHAAGSVPETEKANVQKGGHDGRCETVLAPSGPVYVMIWTTSTDWNNPDKVFQVDLPAYGIKDLGAVAVQD